MKSKMKTILTLTALLTVGLFLGAGGATAAFTSIEPGPETPLLGNGGILDTIYGLGNLQRVDDGIDQIWWPANGGATVQAKFAAFDQNFGYIPRNADGMFYGADFVQLFDVSTNGIGLGGPSATFSAGNVDFLWALDPSGAPLWTSRQGQNSDGLDHMVTWEIINKPYSWVLAWEDLPGSLSGVSDRDFNDLVVEVQVSPVPIPPAFLLLGSGLVGLLGLRKRFKG